MIYGDVTNLNIHDKSNEPPPQREEQDLKSSKKISHETTFYSPVFGPVHTGSGNLEVDGLDYSKAGTQSMDRQQIVVISSIPAPHSMAMQTLIQDLPAGELDELVDAFAQIDADKVPDLVMQEFLDMVRPAIVDACNNSLVSLLIDKEGEDPVKLIDSPSLSNSHKLKVTLPLVPFLIHYEGELALGSKANLEKAWEWIKKKLRRR